MKADESETSVGYLDGEYSNRTIQFRVKIRVFLF